MRKTDRLHGVRIVREDPDVIVVEKPAGLLAQTLRRADAPSVESVLTDFVRKGQWKSARRVYLVHRLDRDTSGLMVVAKTPQVMDWFRDRWNEITEKTYLALVQGVLADDAGAFESYLADGADRIVRRADGPDGGKFARTEWRVLARGAGVTLVAARLRTGRKNQIRVQFADAGHPVAGDAKYGRARAGASLCLHAWKLAFVHPHTRRWVSFETEKPSWTNVCRTS